MSVDHGSGQLAKDRQEPDRGDSWLGRAGKLGPDPRFTSLPLSLA